MTDKVAAGLLEEFGQLKARRINWEGTWKEIQENIVPRRTGFTVTKPEKGERHDSAIYDGSPLSALTLMCQGIQGRTLSPSYRWARVRSIHEPLMKNRDVRLYLDQTGDILFSLLGRSNFYREMHEYLMDAGSFGTATVYITVDLARRQLWFSVRHPREIYIAENEREEVETVFRYTEMSYRQIIEAFNEENLHEDIIKNAKDNPHDTTMIVHAVKLNEQYDPGKADHRGKKFSSWYIDETNEQRINTSGYHVNPYAVWRFYKNSDEEYGRSPAWDALGDIKSIHQYSKTNTTTAQLLGNPPLDIPEERRGLIVYKPGARSYYEQSDREIKLVPTGTGYYVGIDRENQKREAIERAFFVPFFLMLANIEKNMTATEVQRRDEENSIIMGPIVTGLNHDTLNPMFDRIFDIAHRAGWLPPVPEILLRAGGSLEIDYIGPQAQAERRHFQSDPYRSGMVDLSGVFQFNPQVVDNFNWDHVGRELARANAWPEESILPERIVAAIRQQRRQLEEAQRQQEQLESMGKAAKGLNEPAKPDSMLRNIGEQVASR